jgi:hypothetical protein
MGRYHLKGDDTGDWYTVYSYAENGTISAVRHSGRDDFRAIPTGEGTDQWVRKHRGEPLWRVFGLLPDDFIALEPDGAEGEGEG